MERKKPARTQHAAPMELDARTSVSRTPAAAVNAESDGAALAVLPLFLSENQ
jgi:hypothetical protein